MPVTIPSTNMSPLQTELNNYYVSAQAFFNQMQALFNRGDNLIYNNSQGYAASTVAAAMGANGNGVLGLQAVLSTAIMGITGTAPLSNSVLYSTAADPNNIGGIIITPVHNPGPLSTLGGNNI